MQEGLQTRNPMCAKTMHCNDKHTWVHYQLDWRIFTSTIIMHNCNDFHKLAMIQIIDCLDILERQIKASLFFSILGAYSYPSLSRPTAPCHQGCCRELYNYGLRSCMPAAQGAYFHSHTQDQPAFPDLGCGVFFI